MELYLTVMMFIGSFVFLYPIMLSVVWIVGGVFFWHRGEKKAFPNSLSDSEIHWPRVTVLVPCHNEERTIKKTIDSLARVDYQNFLVVFIDDASTDETVSVIREAILGIDNFQLLKLENNHGKAETLNYALTKIVDTPICTVIDADTLLDRDSLKRLVLPFIHQPNLGAVTGNPFVYNRDNLLEKLQTAEFASIIGLIKRAQTSFGPLLTISGCITSFNTQVLKEIHGFSANTATEDIDITWKIQKNHYQIFFEPRAIAYIQVPSSLRDYWKQRTRWSLGGWHLLREHKNVFTSWMWRRLWTLYLEFSLSYIWAFCFVFGSIIWGIMAVLFGAHSGVMPLAFWHGAIISFMCIVQFATALMVSRQYDPSLWRSFFWIPWYPIFFFATNSLAIVRSSIKGLFGELEKTGKWKSPDRLDTSL